MLKSLFQGGGLLDLWLILFVGGGIAAGVLSGFFAARRIQPGRFKWITFRNEIIFSAVNVGIAGFTLGPLNAFLRSHGYISVIHVGRPH